MTTGPTGPLDPPAAAAHALAAGLRSAVGEVWFGQREVLDRVLVAVLAGGHVLLEDVPGVGKTTLASALAQAMGGGFRRLQGTADLLPTDITGGLVPDGASGLVFREGPVFCHVLLADEINRAPARTQSALLEAMAEGAVTVDGVTRALPRPFFVIATQNPWDAHGTHPLPESQLDRFLLRVGIGYPSREAERRILRQTDGRSPIVPVTTPEALRDARAAVDGVRVSSVVEDDLLDLVARSRRDVRLMRGVSPRGAQALLRASQAWALLQGRGFVVPEDWRHLAPDVLGHRVVPRGAEVGDRVIAAMVAEQAAPR